MAQERRLIDNDGLVGIVQRTLNLVDPRLMDHGAHVAYLVYRMARADGAAPSKTLRDLCFVTMLHDIGAYKSEEIDKLVEFETRSVWEHSAYGYLFLKHFSPLAPLAPAVLLHHADWTFLQRIPELSPELRRLAQLINIADRAEIYLNAAHRPASALTATLRARSGTQFSPEAVELFARTVPEGPIGSEMQCDTGFWELMTAVPFSPGEVEAGLEMLIYAIDFRSRHTVTHTMTTAGISRALALRLDLPIDAVSRVACGALLHDLGKIGIPVEILEFPGKLSPQAMSVMRTHVDLTRAILGESVPPDVREIALRHHEKLDGSGYPRGLSADALTLPERIVAVADIVSALHGTRSYKTAFPKERTLSILRADADAGKLDPRVVAVMERDYDEILHSVEEDCEPLLATYLQIGDEFEALLEKLRGS